MALIFSLAAALLAILMQQWVRDYMLVFQRYDDPLKRARVRQYLYDGLKRGWMPGVAEAVPGFLHVSLFLFFAGLCNSVLNINTTVGIGTTVPIAISGLLYIFTTFVPFFRPQSPYHTWFSTIFSLVIWYTKQKWGFDKAKNPVRQNTTEGRMQLAMEESDQRKVRDEEAIRWLIRNMTEEAEMESFVMAIPGSFHCKWGLVVWANVSKPPADNPHTGPMARPTGPDPQNVPPYSTAAHIQGEQTMNELSIRVANLAETCKNRDLFASEELWRKRTRGCVETIVSLVCCADAELSQFGDIAKLLGDIGDDQKLRESSSEGKDQMFAMRWTCLSLVAIRPILVSDRNLHNHARLAISSLTEDQYHIGDKQTPTRIIETFNNALECLEKLSKALILVQNSEEAKAKEVLGNHKSSISTLRGIGDQYDDSADTWIQVVQRDVVKTTHRIICQFPGIKFDDPDTKSVQLIQLKELYRDRHKFQFITPSHRLKRIGQVAQALQNLLELEEGKWNSVAFKEGIKDLQEMLSLIRDDPLRREVWRLQDLREGGGLGFTVELFFLALRQRLSTSSSKEFHSELLIGTFRRITSDWRKYKNSLGTQQLLLHWVVSHNGIMFDLTNTYPDFLINEFFDFLANILEGQGGSHINDIEQQLTEKLGNPYLVASRETIYKRALEVITRVRAQGSTS